MTMDSDAPESSKTPPANAATYFDGVSSRRRAVTLHFAARLEISDHEQTLAVWDYAATRRADSPSGMLRLGCPTASALARLEVRDNALAAELVSRCTKLDENTPGRRGVAVIVGWSLAAAVSILAVVLFGLPLIADGPTPLVPEAFERRIGEAADSQIKTVFGGKVCDNPAGQKAFVKLVFPIRESAGLDTSVQ